jgi:hypothetical protein
MSAAQSWFLQRQQQLTARVGEPVFLTIKMPFHDWFEVEIRTFTDRWGMATGSDLDRTVDDAADMLLEMDEVIAEVEGL